MSIESAVIAVGRDEGDRARRLAEIGVELAASGAELTVVHAFGSQEAADETAARLGYTDGSTSDLARRLDSVREVVRALEASGVSADVDGRVGDPGSVVAAVADSLAADRVVVGGRDRSPTGKAVFGSTAQDVLLSAPCPVTFVRQSE